MGQIFLGDCLEVMKSLEDNSVDAVVVDPPYGLSFMGKKWDYDVPSVEVWKECFRVLKPGGHLLSFGGTRTYHRLVVNIEDAGFEIRDMIQWIYGSGFPKGQDIGKAIDLNAGVKREIVGTKIGMPGYSLAKGKGRNTMNSAEDGSLNNSEKECQITVPATEDAKKWQGWNTTLKPANEPICLARKPLSEKTIVKNVLKHGTGALNIDDCRIATDPDDAQAMERVNSPNSNQLKGRDPISTSRGNKGSDSSAKPFDTTQGRWPANVIHDGSDEVISEFPQSKGAIASISGAEPSTPALNVYGEYKRKPSQKRGDLGSAARFYYCAKASRSDRGKGNNHPTVKPTDLMQYLCRLITPPNGKILDPFMGSGSTGKAAILEGFDFIGIEKDEKYFEIAKQRIQEVLKTVKN